MGDLVSYLVESDPVQALPTMVLLLSAGFGMFKWLVAREDRLRGDAGEVLRVQLREATDRYMIAEAQVRLYQTRYGQLSPQEIHEEVLRWRTLRGILSPNWSSLHPGYRGGGNGGGGNGDDDADVEAL